MHKKKKLKKKRLSIVSSAGKKKKKAKISMARKSTSSPYYRTGYVSGIADTENGLIITALMIPDE